MGTALKYPKEKYPRITVITVVYNRVDMIERAMLSALNQNYPNMEYMVMDAASTDGTVDVINKYRDKIDFFRSYKDSGPTNAINEALDYCTGEIIALLNSDDFFEPDVLIKGGEAFIENPDVEMVNFIGRIAAIGDNGEIKELLRFKPEDLHFEKDRVNPPFTLFRFYKKSLFDKYGKLVEKVNGKHAIATDTEHITRLGIFGVKNVTINHLGYSIIGHEGSISFNPNKYNKLVFHDEKIGYIEQLFEKYDADISPKYRAILQKEYKKAYPRRIVRNFVDKDYKALITNLKIGIKKFGVIVIWKAIRYYFSYYIRFNKLFKKI